MTVLKNNYPLGNTYFGVFTASTAISPSAEALAKKLEEASKVLFAPDSQYTFDLDVQQVAVSTKKNNLTNPVYVLLIGGSVGDREIGEDPKRFFDGIIGQQLATFMDIEKKDLNVLNFELGSKTLIPFVDDQVRPKDFTPIEERGTNYPDSSWDTLEKLYVFDISMQVLGLALDIMTTEAAGDIVVAGAEAAGGLLEGLGEIIGAIAEIIGALFE